MLFRSETPAIVLADAVAFPAGVTIRLQMAARRVERVNDDTWWDRHDLMFGHRRHRFRAEDSLPDEVVRFGVRFPDGSKATTGDGRAVEWPLYDVPLTFTELDGAAIVAAGRAQPYWP
jgi:hypothetical protein